MKAVIQTKYGPPEILKLAEVEVPVPADDEILVKVHAVSVNRSDWEGLTGKPLYARTAGFRRPRNPILGSDVAGRVEKVGKSHSQFRPGDEVFGELWEYRGGFAEYVRTRASDWARIPAGLTFTQAAAIPQAGVIALQGILKQGQLRPRQQVLINGAGGGTGSFAIQLAKLHGAEVTAVDHSGKLDFMRSLGADHVMDHTREDFTKAGRQYDLILDVIAHYSPSDYARALKPGGRYLAVGGPVRKMLQLFWMKRRIERSTGKSVGMLFVRRNREDLLEIAQLCESGRVVPVIDKLYSLQEVPEALRDLGEGQVKGKAVITLQQENRSER